MRLLFDENLSRRLVASLTDLFPGSSHVAFEGLLSAPDTRVWEHAKTNGFAIVTADEDFYDLATTFGPPPKVIWLRNCDYPTAVAERVIRSQAIRVVDFLENPDGAIMMLMP